MLTEEFRCVVESVSFTTRKMRPNEVEGRDYHFISEAEFEKKCAEGEFLEYAHVFDNYYGTSEKNRRRASQEREHVALVIDTQGAKQLKKVLDAVYIFIRPPNFEELKKRLMEENQSQRVD